MSELDWFLAPEERGNPATELDRRHADGRAWTSGNRVEPLIHGAAYYARLYERLCQLGEGDFVHLTDWRGDDDERLRGPGTEIGVVLAELARHGVQVRGLFWRSHLGRFSERENAHFAERVNEAGGEVLLDERVRGPGSHHQKLLLLRRPGREDEDVAFVGGIDLCHGRNDDERHLGDPQAIEMDERYGPRPPWHDIQLEVRGPAVGDLALTFRERWEDPTPLDHRNPVRARIARALREPRRPRPLPPMPEDPSPCGTHAVQVLRTYPARRPRFPFAPAGERSIARAYMKAIARARRLIYIEDQYLWSEDVAAILAAALERQPRLHLIAVVPPFPDEDGFFSGPPSRIGQLAAVERVKAAASDRVEFYDLENEAGSPIYVHAKACVIDDVWASVGSDNFNRRSWTNDSELSCAILDETRDEREPRDPAELGDGARTFARNLRMRLWSEHLGVPTADDRLLDPEAGFRLWQHTAERLRLWKREGRGTPRPAGRVLPHEPEAVPGWARWWCEPVYRWLVDPDGRPRDLRRARRF